MTSASPWAPCRWVGTVTAASGGVEDTAGEAAVLRRQGIRPVCIFTGSDQELDSARRIYGAAVERIPTAGWLADAVSRLLCAQLTRT